MRVGDQKAHIRTAQPAEQCCEFTRRRRNAGIGLSGGHHDKSETLGEITPAVVDHHEPGARFVIELPAEELDL